MIKPYYDVVIIGGGIIGLCSAYYLTQEGISVVIIDSGPIGHGSSFRNAGYMSPSHFVPLAAPGVFTQGLKWMFNSKSPLYIQPRLDLGFLAWSLQFARACHPLRAQKAAPILLSLLQSSQALTQKLVTSEKMDVQLESRGITMLFNSEKGRLACTHEADLARSYSVAATLLSPTELKAMDPELEIKAQGGLHFPEDMHLRPEALVENLIQWLRARNVPMIPDTEVIGFETSGKESERTLTRVKMPHRLIHGKEFVLCGGAWSTNIARTLDINMLLQAGKGYSITVSTPSLKPKLPYICVEKRVAITPFADGLRFAGTMEFSGTSTQINAKRVEAILDAVPLYFDNLPRPEVQSSLVWAGLRPVSPDGLPYLGRHRPFRNLITATGHAMLGVSLAAITGKTVRDLIVKSPPEHDLTLLSPNRYDSF